jgi:hypothetical protein
MPPCHPAARLPVGPAALLALAALLGPPARAAEVVLRNDTNSSDTYNEDDQVAWLAYPECAITVLTPDAWPVTLDAVRLYLGSSSGDHDGEETSLTLGLQLLDEGAAPTGPGSWDWDEEAFFLQVSSTSLSELCLVDAEAGLGPLTVTEGSVAVWICAPDPATGETWPYSGASNVSGVVIDTDSPSTGSYLFYDGEVMRLNSFINGAWIIRAVETDGGCGSGGGSDGGSDGTDGGDGAADGGDGGGGGGTDGAGADLIVASLTPSEGAVGAAVELAVVGSGFVDGATLHLGGLLASDLVVAGDSALTARAPTGLPAGVHDLVVTLPDGASATLAGAWTVVDAPADPKGGGCGCAGGVGPGAGLMGVGAGLAGALRRRRRAARG